MGIGYVIEHYIAFFQKEQEEKTYRNYITDSLKIISENTAKAHGGSFINVRYADIVAPHKEETRTADEVIENLRKKMRHLL